MSYPYNLSLVALISAAAAAWHLSSPTGGNVDWAQEDTRPSPPLQPLKYFCEVTDDVTVCRGVVEQAPAYLPGDVGDKRKYGMIQSNVNKLCSYQYEGFQWLSVTSMKDSNGSSPVQVVTYDCDKTTLQNKYDKRVLPFDWFPSECMAALGKKTKCQWGTGRGTVPHWRRGTVDGSEVDGYKVQRTTGVANNQWQFVPSCNIYIVPVTNEFCPRHMNNSQATARICAGEICMRLEPK